jgi:Met-zincin/Domain of unknown function (DUF5117)/Domain of unknown function (DUF5118)
MTSTVPGSALVLLLAAVLPSQLPDIEAFARKMAGKTGFFTIHQSEGKLYLTIPRWDAEFLYVNSLPSGVGSNDIGLDRGKLGSTKVVRFRRVGKRVMLVQRNLGHRATTSNPDEKRAVTEAFASSILWAFDIVAADQSDVVVDATKFCVRDAFNVAGALKRSRQGDYKLDERRSFVDWSGSGAFPKNTEMQATLTFAGKSPGRHVRGVVPTPRVITVQQRYSFIQLPDAGYRPRRFDPRTGYSPVTWRDYATPIAKPLTQQFIRRHRLIKKDPTAVSSEVVEPIVYYLDPGAPEPIRSALLDGARWWTDAFTAAGFKNAFRVEMLPSGADPMDVRYNVVQWVHRSSRGWSYGNSITDPRTGEIIKGHVSLGSRRVRQDYLIAQALVGPDRKRCEAMALARLRQLSAHEIGHTLGLVHNFAASTVGRASVMDYPHPLLRLTDRGVDLSNAYGVGVGKWDTFAIRWGYSSFVEDERRKLDDLVATANQEGLRLLSDADARPAGSMHPAAHLWDNGEDTVAELQNLLAVRRHCMDRFGPELLGDGEPLTRLDELITPLYLLHRYQTEAVSKLIGGVEYTITRRGDPRSASTPVSPTLQRKALAALLHTLDAEVLVIPDRVARAIPPRTHGTRRRRELLPSHSGVAFDPLAAAAAAAGKTVAMLLHPQRAARVVAQHARDAAHLSLDQVLTALIRGTLLAERRKGASLAVQRVVDSVVVDGILNLAVNPTAPRSVLAIVERKLRRFPVPADSLAHVHVRRIERFLEHPERFDRKSNPELPPGSPIGCACGR